MNDRHQLEVDFMKPLESGSGPFGSSKIDLGQRKKNICGVEDKKNLPQNDDLIRLLQQDGIYIDSMLMFKNKDINI